MFRFAKNLKSNLILPKRCSSSMSKCPVVTEKRGDIFLIAINRPEKRNCVNAETASLLVQAFKQLDADDDVSVGILHGKGGTFCAGYDLEELSTLGGLDGQDSDKYIKPAPMGPSHMMTKKPLIAAIDGYAVAGGLELALLCDLRVVDETAILGVFCRRFGVPLIDGGTVRLPKIIGLGRALDMILTGRPVDGKEALAMGLANDIASTGSCLGRALNLAQSISKFNQNCVQVDRQSAYYSTFGSNSLQDALDFEFKQGSKIILSDSVAGATMFSKDKVGRHGKSAVDTLDTLMERGKKKGVKSKLLDE